VTCCVNLWAYYDERALSTELGFWCAAVTAGVLFAAWFWGAFLLMSGVMSGERFGVLVVHAALGSVLPLVFMLQVSVQLETFTSQPVGEGEVLIDIAGVVAVLIQAAMGWSVAGSARGGD
jgi:hypothetical protein